MRVSMLMEYRRDDLVETGLLLRTSVRSPQQQGNAALERFQPLTAPGTRAGAANA